ncbi:MAG: hypothetical protein ACD_2C00200G0005 [uncultured bacterium (gcode 4)]|uniref:Uncharacterized protein n=1 Tax=uncultured bacterium (gcode 4) TaxID=1234023 RepID=K2GFY5_9BACT|nr:MAG: hypothetical protein ACD_2C00200G0005 [uncultured bacterium (gcode 4)]
MSKINANLITKIRDLFSSDKNAYVRIKLDISKAFFAISASLYFFFYLSTIAWFQVDLFWKLLVWIFPVFLFSIVALAYDLLVYVLSLYSEKTNALKIPILVILWIFYVAVLTIFLGLKF